MSRAELARLELCEGNPCAVLSDGRTVRAMQTAGGAWVAIVQWSPDREVIVPAIDHDDAAWLATAYVLGATAP